MGIEQAELWMVSLPLVSPFEAAGQVLGAREALIVSLREDGLAGWGEVSAFGSPWYTGETLAGAARVLREHLLPSILGREVQDIDDFSQLTGWVRGNQMARSGLEMAWWDLQGHRAGKSLSSMLGGARERVEVGVSMGLQPDVEQLLRAAAEYRKQGYGRIKIKVGPRWLAEPVRALRREFGPDLPLQVDANSAFSPADAALFQELDDAGLLLIEQPLAEDDLVEHAALQAQLRTPICLDESIESPADARAALALGSCGVINVKPGRVGGLSRAVAIHDICLARGVPVWCGGMLETGIGRAANLALASLPGFTLPGDISATARYFHEDIVEERFELDAADSTIAVPWGPGLGVSIDQEALARATRWREVVRG